MVACESGEAMLLPVPAPLPLLRGTRPRPQLFEYHLPPVRHTHRTRDVAWEGKRKVPEEQVLLCSVASLLGEGTGPALQRLFSRLSLLKNF